MKELQVKQTTVIRSGKLIFAIVMEKVRDKEDSAGSFSNKRDKTVITMDKGTVNFSDSRYFDSSNFDLSDETHLLAREIFITELQTDIKRRVLELQQLEAVLKEIGAIDLLGTSLEDASKGLFVRFKSLLPQGKADE